MDNNILDKDNINKRLNELEAKFSSDDEMEKKAKEKISQAADKGRSFIDRAENAAGQAVEKASEKKEKIMNKKEDLKERALDKGSDKTKKYLWKALGALAVILLIKKIKNKKD